MSKEYLNPNYVHVSKLRQPTEAPHQAPGPKEDIQAMLVYMIINHSPKKEDKQVRIPVDEFEKMEYHGTPLLFEYDQEANEIVVSAPIHE